MIAQIYLWTLLALLVALATTLVMTFEAHRRGLRRLERWASAAFNIIGIAGLIFNFGMGVVLALAWRTA